MFGIGGVRVWRSEQWDYFEPPADHSKKNVKCLEKKKMSDMCLELEVSKETNSPVGWASVFRGVRWNILGFWKCWCILKCLPLLNGREKTLWFAGLSLQKMSREWIMAIFRTWIMKLFECISKCLIKTSECNSRRPIVSVGHLETHSHYENVKVLRGVRWNTIELWKCWCISRCPIVSVGHLEIHLHNENVSVLCGVSIETSECISKCQMKQLCKD